MGCCCGKNQVKENVFVNRISSALAKRNTWVSDIFQFENIKTSRVLYANHYLLYPKQKAQLSGEMTVLIKLIYNSQPIIDRRNARVPVNTVEPEYQRELYPITLLVFPVKQNIVNYIIPKDAHFKLTDCAYFNLTMRYGECYIIVPVVKQLTNRNLDYKLEIRPREDTHIVDISYNSNSRRFESRNGDSIKLHMQMCYACKNFLFEDDNIVQQRGLLYHYNCAKYTCQLCNLEIENRNNAVLCDGMVYHKECLDIILRCSQCNRPAKSYYNTPNSPQLCESCYMANLKQQQNQVVEAHMINFWD